MVLVSILTPVYNGVEYLEECVKSVLLQTFQDWELLIGINGHGVTGGEAAVIAHALVKDPRIRVIVQPPPLTGKVESLHDLLSRCSAPWIAVLDCDDKWEPLKLERQMDALRSDAQYADAIGTYCQYFGERHDRITLPSGYVDPAILMDYNPMINSSALIKKERCTWKYTDINYGVEDFDLWMNICLDGGKLYNIPEYLTWHRIHPTSAFNSKGYSDEAIRTRYAVLYKISRV
jgi:teichuronic acid biosynthesis glycosyltransferase TuaG